MGFLLLFGKNEIYKKSKKEVKKLLNISGALKQVKQLKNELKRKIKMRRENFFVVIPKDSTLEDLKENVEEVSKFVNFENISEEINVIAEKISNLRERIMRTNIHTEIDVNDRTMTLSRLKLVIDDIRSELAQLDTINERDSFGFRRRRIATTEEEEKEVAQLTDLQLEVLIKQLEERKLKLENILEIHNANTQLIE